MWPPFHRLILVFIRDVEPGQFIEALFELGFKEIRESAEGAIYVTSAYEELMREGSMENIIHLPVR